MAGFGAQLAAETEGADPAVVEAFAWLHDCQRESDGDDPGHGARAARLAVELAGSGRLPLSREQLELLVEACARHTDGETSDDATIGVCFDADRLDLLRLGVQPDPALLSTEAGRRRIGWAEQIIRGEVEAFWRDAEERWEAVGTGQTLVDEFIARGVPAFASSHGLGVDEYRAEVERLLRRLTHEAQVRIRVPTEALPAIRREGLKNTFQLARSRITPEQAQYRLEYEREYLGLPDDAPATERPVYAYLHSSSWGAEHAGLGFYGQTILVLDDLIKSRCSVVFGTFVRERFVSGTPSPLLAPRLESAFPFDVLNADYDPTAFPPEAQVADGVAWDDVLDVLE